MKQLLFLLLFSGSVLHNVQGGTFTEYHSIYCGSILELGPVGYPTWNEAKVLQAPAHGQVFIFTGQPFPDSMVYKSDYGYLGQDTFVVECAHATQITCDTGIYIISVIGCPPIWSFTATFEMDCDSILTVPGLGYPVWATPEILQPPSNGEAFIFQDSSLWHLMEYTPNPGFSGSDTIVVECAHATQVTCETGFFIIHVSCLNSAGERGSPGLKIFPNPVAGRLRVQSEQPIERLRLTNLQGVTLWEVAPGHPGFEFEVEMGSLPAGFYFLEIGQGGVSTVSKILKH